MLPAELRHLDRIEEGQELDVERIDAGEYRLKRRDAPLHRGLMDWLHSCPEPGYFVPIPSESTDTL